MAHLAVLLDHASAHIHLRIAMKPWQQAFIAIMVFAAPLLAMILLWTRAQTAGLFVLASCMASSFIFGVWFHFIARGSDNALTIPQGDGSRSFLASAALLALVEVSAFVWAVVVVRTASASHRLMTPSS